MNLYELVMLVDKFGLVLKNTKMDYNEVYGDWDIPDGFYLTFDDGARSFVIEGKFVLPDTHPSNIFKALATLSYTRVFTDIVIREGPLTVKRIPYSDFLKSISQ